MRKDHRLSRALHVLIHMDKIRDPVTSEDIASMINTNPVVVRRLSRGSNRRVSFILKKGMEVAGHSRNLSETSLSFRFSTLLAALNFFQ